jgi:hypothetical protein
VSGAQRTRLYCDKMQWIGSARRMPREEANIWRGKHLYASEIWVFHGDEDSNRGVQRCETMWCGRIPTFRRTLLPPSSGWSEWGVEVNELTEQSIRGVRVASGPVGSGVETPPLSGPTTGSSRGGSVPPPLVRGPFAKFVNSPYYSESELCGGAVTVSFSKYLRWQAMLFLQRPTHFLENVLQTFDNFEISCLEVPLSWLEKPRYCMGARSELNSMFCLEKVDRWNPIRTSVIQSRSRPMRFLGFSNRGKGPYE